MFLNELQQLQQQNPTQFKQVLSEVTSQLQQAASQASASGNTTQANNLTNLATTFQNAESGGPLPTAQQLQQAGLVGHHHHHHGHHGGQSSLMNLFQTSSDTDSQTLASSIFGSTTGAGSTNPAASIFS